MANPKNTAELAELKEKIAESSSIVITEYRGLSVAPLQELRTNLGLDEHLSGPTAFAFIKGEAVDAAKVMKKFADDNEALVVKGGYMDGSALSADQVKAIADLDNRETTLAKLAGAMKGNLAKAAGLF